MKVLEAKKDHSMIGKAKEQFEKRSLDPCSEACLEGLEDSHELSNDGKDYQLKKDKT